MPDARRDSLQTVQDQLTPSRASCSHAGSGHMQQQCQGFISPHGCHLLGTGRSCDLSDAIRPDLDQALSSTLSFICCLLPHAMQDNLLGPA